MKYNININQKAIIDLNLDVDVIDMAIFDFIKDFSNSSKCVKVLIDGKQFFWISHSKIILDLPIININSRQGILKRINKLIDANLIQRADGDLQKSYYCFGLNYDSVCFVTDRQQTLSPTDNDSLHQPDNDSCHNYNTTNNSTKYNKREIKFFSDSFWNNYENLKNHFASKEDLVKRYAYCDLKYYIERADHWSETSNNGKGTKRTDKGWLTTIIGFIEQAKLKNEMRTIEIPKKPQGHTNH